MRQLAVIDKSRAALCALDPSRSKILAALGEPGSATTVASSLGLSRQKVNYHLRSLEEHGLVSLHEERPRRGLTERVMVASAQSYVLSPTTLGANAAQPERTDKLSSSYLIAIAARLVQEVGELTKRAETAGQPLATLTIDSEVRFASAGERAAFTAELSKAVSSLVSKYHDAESPNGRSHRIIVAAHPTPGPSPTSTQENS